MKHLKLFILVGCISFLPRIANAQVMELSERQLFEKVCRGYEHDIKYVGDKPCVLLFHNGTCPFAKRVGNMLETLSRKYKGNIYFYKVNVWNLSDTTLENFNFEGVPQTYFFRTDGYATYDLGMLDMDDLEERVEYLLEVWN